MMLSTLLIHVAPFAGVLSEEVPTGGEPYVIPPITAFTALLILTTVLVLAMYFNARLYQPPPVLHLHEEPAGGGHGPEHG